MWSTGDDAALRAEAMKWLAAWTNDGLDSISRETLGDFRFRGEKVRLIDQTKGIWKPRFLPATLSIVTGYRPPGVERPYEDAEGSDGLMRYKRQKPGRGADATNQGLRNAREMQAPLIWFWTLAPGVLKPIYPVFIIDEEPELDQFVVATDGLQYVGDMGSEIEEISKGYALRETRQRIHQPVFRGLVMQAYETRCAVCALGHSSLLDAAHVVPDSEDAGIAAVRNALALCKIHHAAYDAQIMGISPNYRVEIRDDILAEIDGPMLEHGLKGVHGNELMIVPNARASKPDRDLLAHQFDRFKSAAASSRTLRADIAFRRAGRGGVFGV